MLPLHLLSPQLHGLLELEKFFVGLLGLVDLEIADVLSLVGVRLLFQLLVFSFGCLQGSWVDVGLTEEALRLLLLLGLLRQLSLIAIDKVRLNQSLLNLRQDLHPTNAQRLLIEEILILSQEIYKLFCALFDHDAAVIWPLDQNVHGVLLIQAVHVPQRILLAGELELLDVRCGYVLADGDVPLETILK